MVLDDRISNLSDDLLCHPNIFISPTLVVLKLEWLGIASDTSCVYLPSLKTLNLKYVYIQTRNDYIDFLSACPILQDLDAQHIIYRELDGYNPPEERFKPLTLSKLVRASIDSRHAIFNVVKNVEFLSIKMEQEISSKVVPMFQNLIHTELVFWYGSFVCWDSVVELLQHSPKLQIIFIRKWSQTSSSKEWKYPSSILECVSSHLRSCTILNFDGSANDLRFARYILQNASLLENMKINVTTNGVLLEKSQIIELSSCPMISPTCKLSFGDK
ncbi:hypothetical protein P8452_18407 [Trifolium repens]|nr:hypothetical protein P8452_18407 [Trifolium repens]